MGSIASGSKRADAAPTNSVYVDALVALAKAKKLDTSEQWLRLGHWRGSGKSYRSEADGKDFFLASSGASDPAAELEATIRGYYSSTKPEKLDHALCRFPARFLYLKKELSFDQSKLPVVTCPKFEEYWKHISVKSLTLVFSSYYLNNPSSAFGHTFLRLNKMSDARSEGRRALLDLGVNYAANPGDENAILYALKGLTGGYAGVWSLVPYYYKVREYNDFESRDIWEYDLNLTPGEVEIVAAHLWELGQTYFDYFYLSENCSYHILGAIEVANPKYRLLDRIHYPVVPADTVKALYTIPGLVSDVHYRPSLRSAFRQRVMGFSSEELDLVEALVDDPETAFPAGLAGAKLIRVIDAALDLLDLRFAKEINQSKESHGSRLKQRLMERRAELGIASEDLTFDLPKNELPHLSHGASRVGFGFGFSEGRKDFLAIDYRLALHDLADSPIGYPEFSQLEFFNFRFRVSLQDRTLPRLEDASLIRIISLNPWTRFDKKPSWKLRVGATRIQDSGCPNCTFGVVEVGSGVAVGETVTAFGTLDAKFHALRFTGDEGVKARAGIGPTVGLRIRFSDKLISLTSGTVSWLPFQHPKATYGVETALRWQYAQNFSLGVELRKQPLASEAMISTYVYY